MILVTGANGLIGSFICKELHRMGIPFCGLVRENSDLALLKGIDPNSLRVAEITDPVVLREALKDIQSIIHCAAMISFAPSERKRMFQVNVVGTKTLLDQALDAGVKRFVHISSVAAIAGTKDNPVLREENLWPGAEAPSYYGETKYLAELEVFRASVEGLSIICLNPSTVLGPGDWTKSSTRLFKYVWDEKKFYTKGTINFVDIRDVSAIAIEAINLPIENERYILSGGHMSYKEFFEKVGVAFKKNPPTILATPMMVKLSVVADKFKSVLLRKTPLITRETARSSQKNVIYDNKKLLESIPFTFTDPDETIQWVCNELAVEK